MYNFKFNFLSRGQLVCLNLGKIFLLLWKKYFHAMRFFGNVIFATIAGMLCSLKTAKPKTKTSNTNFGELKPPLKLSQ